MTLPACVSTHTTQFSLVSGSLFPIMYSLHLPLSAFKKQEMMSFLTNRRFFEWIYFIWWNKHMSRTTNHALIFSLPPLCLLKTPGREPVTSYLSTVPSVVSCESFWQRDSELKQLSMGGTNWPQKMKLFIKKIRVSSCPPTCPECPVSFGFIHL
jgi:hypothetical protein